MSAGSEVDLEALSATRRSVRTELADSITSFVIDETTPSTVRFHGSATYGPSLKGPPGRLHGGLHAYARLFPLLDALPAHDATRTFPCRITLGLGKAILLEETVPFEGTYTHDAKGFALNAQHHGSDRLRATLRSVDTVAPPLDRFREAYEACRDAVPEGRILAAGDLPTTIHRDLVIIDASREGRKRSPSLAKHLCEAENVDVATMCVLLDVAAAVVLGFEVKGRCYTVRMDLVLIEHSVPEDIDLLAISDRRTRPDESVSVRPVQIGERTYGPTAVDVVLTNSALTHAWAYGTVTLIPVRRETT